MRLTVRAAVGRVGGAEVTILVASAIGSVGVMWFPSQLGASAGAGAEFALVVNTLALAAAVAGTVTLAHRHPGRRFLALVGEVVSPAVAPLAGLLTAALDVALAAVVLVASSVTMASAFLPLTPIWAVQLLLLAPAAYGAGLGLEAMARTLDVAGPITAAVLVATCLFTLSQAHFGPAIFGGVPAIGGWGAILSGAYASAWALGGVTLVPNVCAQIAPEQRPRLRGGVVLGAAVATVMSFGLLVIDLAVLGVTGLSWYEWPTVSMLRQTRTEAFLINRVGGLDEWVFVVMTWAFVGLHLWNAAVNVTDLLARGDRSERGPAMPLRNAALLGALVLAVYAVSRAFGQGAALAGFSSGYLSPAVVAIGVALPCALVAVDAARRRLGGRKA